jgi:hypothetical protein
MMLAQAQSETESIKSRYTFIDEDATLRIEGVGRIPVTISHTGTSFRVKTDEGRLPGVVNVGLFEYYRLSALVASVLMSEWEGDPKHARKVDPAVARFVPPQEYHAPKAVRKWAVRNTAKAIGKRLHAWYGERLAETPPAIRDVQRTAFAATLGTPEVLLKRKFYELDPMLLDDLKKYRAACVALMHASAGQGVFSSIRAHHGLSELSSSPEYAQLQALADRLGVEVMLGRGRPSSLVRGDGESEAEWVVRVMRGWRGLFSPTGESYRSLDRTLMNLPGGVPPAILPYLAMIRLRRPILTRLELATVCLYGQMLHAQGEGDPLGVDREHDPRESKGARRNKAVFLNARPDRIKRALKLVAGHTRNPLSPRRTKDLAVVVRFLMDYPEEHRGNIVGLAEKSIAWHRAATRAEAERVIAKLGGKRETARPPIEVPDDPRIRFLSSVEEVVEEGRLMNNCVASYASYAVRGSSLLFHVEKDGEPATVEVSPRGHVVQAAGPRNHVNAAAKWGKRALSGWGKKFPKEARDASVVGPLDDDFEIPF